MLYSPVSKNICITTTIDNLITALSTERDTTSLIFLFHQLGWTCITPVIPHLPYERCRPPHSERSFSHDQYPHLGPFHEIGILYMQNYHIRKFHLLLQYFLIHETINLQWQIHRQKTRIHLCKYPQLSVYLHWRQYQFKSSHMMTFTLHSNLSPSIFSFYSANLNTDPILGEFKLSFEADNKKKYPWKIPHFKKTNIQH